MNRTNVDIIHLETALVCAKYEVQKVDCEDGGSCNFDTPYIVLPGWSESDVEKAFKFPKLRPYKLGEQSYEILDAVEGQGFRRTAMAEAFATQLRAWGYSAGVRNVLD